LCENPHISSPLLAVLALIVKNLPLTILEESSYIFSAFSSADKTALAVRTDYR
jgi:hypothetical protein